MPKAKTTKAKPSTKRPTAKPPTAKQLRAALKALAPRYLPQCWHPSQCTNLATQEFLEIEPVRAYCDAHAPESGCVEKIYTEELRTIQAFLDAKA